MATILSSWLDDAFKSAKEEFKKSLKNPALYDFSKVVKIEDVYDEAARIQREQAKTRTLRGLKRLEPLINGLKEYSAVVEVFIPVKPDVMSLIWGPLKLILQASSSVILAFEKVVQVIRDIGMTLPNFKVYAQLFQSNHDICRALCLFYADILDFYAVLLNFLTDRRRLNVLLEALWPNIRSKISKVQENIEQHKAMMTTNVTLEDVLRAEQARKLALEESEHQQAFRDRQTFHTIRTELNPTEYDAMLVEIARKSSVSPGEWLKGEPDFMKWLDAVDRTVRCMWLHGIPGSGKTFLVGNIIKRMQNSGQRVLFAFLSHDNQPAGDTINVLHTILFQLLEDDSNFRSIVYEASQSNHRKLKSDPDFVMDLLGKILKVVGPSFIIIDGMDELEETSWKRLLSDILQLHENCSETKLLISSREERDISLRLREKATLLRVDHRNLADINSFVQLECQTLLLEMVAQGADNLTCHKVKEALSTIAENAEGMFIYARLVLHMVSEKRTVPDIEAEAENLPRGLDQVYGRLLTRIKSRPTTRVILQWIACARRPLTEEEVLQILVIKPGQLDFPGASSAKARKEFRDIRKECGPIIEINKNTIRFVHFSAKEYLLHEQSKNFLDITEGHLDAALTCATYLSFSSLDALFTTTSDDRLSLREHATDGDYVMFEYASMEFLEHLISYFGARNPDLDTRLLTTIARLQETRGQESLDTSNIPSHFTHIFESLTDHPILHALLSAIACFQRKAQLGLLDSQEATDSSMSDPLKLFFARHRFRQSLESLLGLEPNQEPLQRLYGTKLYYCDQEFCHAYRKGFVSKSVRDQHLGIHDRSHKCPEANCPFAGIGFRDTVGLQTHMYNVHPTQTCEDDCNSGLSLRQPLVNTYEVLVDAVMLDQLESVKQLLPEELARIPLENDLLSLDILNLAAWKATPATLSYIICKLEESAKFTAYKQGALATALETENLPNIKLLLSHGADMSKDGFVSADIENKFRNRKRIDFHYNGYIRALSLWSPRLMEYLTGECKINFPIELRDPADIFANPGVYKVAVEDARMRFKGIKQYVLWPEAYARGVWYAAETGSVLGVMICLENGGDPNPAFIPRNKKNRQKSPLYLAVKAGGRSGAEMVKVLLQYGADPLSEHCNGMETLAGMKKIQKLFGLPWKEIVHRIQAGEDLAIT